MRTSRDARLANLLGAVATGLADRVADSVDTTALDGRAQMALVALLDFSPKGSVHTLSQVIGLTHSGTVRLVDRLVDAGYVHRGPGADDRSVSIGLTRAGRTVANRVRDRRQDAITDAMTDLSDRQRDDLVRACESIVANLTRERLDRRAVGEQPSGGALCRMCDFAACGRPAGRCPAAGTVARR
jgi:MarR family transcriptional regulator, negative regulator of the multidrug operon emrRAB